MDACEGQPWSGIARDFPAMASDEAPTQVASAFERIKQKFLRDVAAEFSVPADRLRLHITLVGGSMDVTIPLV
jgi:hypothetical protein